MPRRIKLTLSLIVIVFLFFLVVFLPRQYVVPVIMYHQVNPKATFANKLSISVDTFERQMRFLKNKHYNVISLEALADLIKEKKHIPPKTIAITFDDGYKDNYVYAFAVLRKYRLPATVFIIVKEVGRTQGDRLNWDQIKIMQDSGLVTFGSHAMGPDPLTKAYSRYPVKLSLERYFKEQVSDSKEIIQQRLAKSVTLFSYPEGKFNAAIRQAVIDAGYKAAATTSPGKNYPNNDVFALKRIRVSESARNLFIFWVQVSGYYTFLKEHRHK